MFIDSVVWIGAKLEKDQWHAESRSVLQRFHDRKIKLAYVTDYVVLESVKFAILGEKVHQVGYRAMLLDKAFSLGIDYFSVFNSTINGRRAVILLVDGEEGQVNEIRDFIKSYKPEKAVVEEIREEEYKANVPSIDRSMQAFQTEQCSEGIPILIEIRDNTRPIPEIAENTRPIPEIAENTRPIPELVKKQDETISVIREESKKTREDLKDTLNRGFDGLKQEHIKTREISKEIFYSEVQELRQEIKSLRSSVEEIRRKVGIA